MSTHNLRARLNRVEQIIKKNPKSNRKRSGEFTIDPALANKLRTDFSRLSFLVDAPILRFRERTDVETKEMRKLENRVPAMANEVILPAGYGRNELCRDHYRLNALRRKRDPLTDAKLFEENQIVAREIAHSYQTDDGHAWRRIEELRLKESRRPLNRDELNEIIRLNSLYPYLPPDPDDVIELHLDSKLGYIEGIKRKAIKLREFQT